MSEEAVADAIADALGEGLHARSPGMLKAARAAIAAMQSWRPIEEAPRDGRHFLVWDRSRGVRIGFALQRASHDDWLLYRDADGGSWKGGTRATHFMPLPPPPQEKP